MAALATTLAQDITALQRQFVSPPDDSRIMMRWWWFGPTVTKPELERELRLMKEAGIGGVEIQPLYPVVLDDPTRGLKSLPFLSDEFIDAVKFTQEKARELGLRVDLTVGSGWPFGGPTVTVNEAASRLRVDRIKLTPPQRRIMLPALAEGESLIAVFAGLQELTDIKDGAVWLPAQLQEQNEILVFISSRTGQQVKRAALGGEGFVLNHYDQQAVENYQKKVGDRLLQAFGNHPPYAVFCDSLEVFNSDWTPALLDEFKQRRGYDLRPLLPALVKDIGPQTSAIRHDWGQTLTELNEDRFLKPMQAWATHNKTRFRIQGYGIPPMTMSGNALVDLPEGEGYQWKVVRASRWASSASHIYNKPITSSETWTWLHSPSFRATPLDTKAEADIHFLQGINQLIGHGWPYTAPDVAYPGWRLYAAGVFNEKNPWWIVMPDLTQYLQRISFMLRQGQPANDVALYLPNHDVWSKYVNGRVHYLIEALRDHIGADAIPEILAAGFNLDFFDDAALQNVGRIEQNALVLGKNKYKAVILPNVEHIPLATLRQIETFAKQGGTVIATRRLPQLAPGLKATTAEQAEIRAIAARLFEGSTAKGQFLAQEKNELGKTLAARVQPDVLFSSAGDSIGFIRRHLENAEIYFLANTSNITQNLTATFRVQGLNPELWDPLTGSVTPLAGQQTTTGFTAPLQLEPYGSRLVVFSQRVTKTNAARATTVQSSIELSGAWQVTFAGNDKPVQFNQLQSWSEHETTRYFSGTATYEKNIVLTPAQLNAGNVVLLDFGAGQAIPETPRKNGFRAWFDAPIRDAAVIYINNQRVGSLWCPPYSIDITKQLKAGNNQLKLIVGNTAINHMAGQRQPDYKLLTLRYGDRFQPQDMENLQPLPSGILAPVRLRMR